MAATPIQHHQAYVGKASVGEHAFLLGPANSKKGVPGQGWQFETEIREAEVKEAGFGRKALVPLKKGSPMIEKFTMPMAKVKTLLNIPYDTTITFASVDDLEKYIKLGMTEGNYSREEILEYYEHFMYGFDGVVTGLNVCTWTVNHQGSEDQGLNCNMFEKYYPDGRHSYYGIAAKDIKVGDEIYHDYRRFKIPEFYKEYCKKHNFKSVRQITLEAVYGSDEESVCGKPFHGPFVPNPPSKL